MKIMLIVMFRIHFVKTKPSKYYKYDITPNSSGHLK